jgi:hypothetical protein
VVAGAVVVAVDELSEPDPELWVAEPDPEPPSQS